MELLQYNNKTKRGKFGRLSKLPLGGVRAKKEWTWNSGAVLSPGMALLPSCKKFESLNEKGG